MASDVFRSKRHDNGMSPLIHFTPQKGLGWDLTEAGLTATLIARAPGAAAPKMSGAAVVVGPWSVRYDPSALDVDTIGDYRVEVEIVRSNTRKVTFPTSGTLQWVIEEDQNNA